MRRQDQSKNRITNELRPRRRRFQSSALIRIIFLGSYSCLFIFCGNFHSEIRFVDSAEKTWGQSLLLRDNSQPYIDAFIWCSLQGLLIFDQSPFETQYKIMFKDQKSINDWEVTLQISCHLVSFNNFISHVRVSFFFWKFVPTWKCLLFSFQFPPSC